VSQRGSIYRYGLIVKKLQQKPYSSFKEIRDYMEYQISYLQDAEWNDDLTIGLSLRTFQREIKNIYILYGILIEYSRKHKGYFISETAHDTANFDRMMQAFDLFNSLNIAQEMTPYILLDNRKNLGLEYLQPIIHSLKKRLILQIKYQKFKDEMPSERSLEPYAVKEFKNRWYLIAIDRSDEQIKVYALDRIRDLVVSHLPFERQEDVDVQEAYKNAFGIILTDQEPQTVILHTDAIQAEYFRTLPLHPSQEILQEDNQILVKLYLPITPDFIMELLSLSQYITVIEPQALRLQIRDILQASIQKYL